MSHPENVVRLLNFINDAWVSKKLHFINEDEIQVNDIDGAIDYLKDNKVPITISNHNPGRRIILVTKEYLVAASNKLKESS